MKAECYISRRCASERALRENISRAAALEGVPVELRIRHITDEEAGALGLRGSPSVFINEKELQPVEMPGFA